MYRKSLIASVGVQLFFYLLLYESASAQLSAATQLRTRTEIRNGLGNLVLKGSKPAAFTSQRTRLSLGYKLDRLTFGVVVQDVRVWGQDASSMSNADGNRFMLHEGWADLVLANKADTSIRFKIIDALSLKIGRQELSYDDVRLLGNLDWLQQARRHDMALLKASHKGFLVEVGVAYNQNSDAFGITNTSYVPANVPSYIKNSAGVLVLTPAGMLPLAATGNAALNSSKTGSPVWSNPPGTNGASQDYKSFFSLYASRKVSSTKFSALFFNDNFGKYRLDSIGSSSTGYVYGRRFVSAGSWDKFDYSGLNRRYTYGFMVIHSIGKSQEEGKVDIQAAYYVQGGRNRDGDRMKGAYHYTISTSLQKGRFTLTPGFDALSGNKPATAQDEKFDPLYGTPHRHWGYMDFFYVGTGSPAGGLNNAYLKIKYATGPVTFGLDLHQFSINTSMYKVDGSPIDKRLGNEIDFVMNYGMNKFTNIELGYARMLATASMPLAKGQATSDIAAEDYRKTGNWVYAMIRFSAELFHQRANSKIDQGNKNL